MNRIYHDIKTHIGTGAELIRCVRACLYVVAESRIYLPAHAVQDLWCVYIHVWHFKYRHVACSSRSAPLDGDFCGWLATLYHFVVKLKEY